MLGKDFWFILKIVFVIVKALREAFADNGFDAEVDSRYVKSKEV